MLKAPIKVVDVSARDGLQNEPRAENLTPQDKVDYITLLIQAGLSRIEAGSFVKPSAVPSMANSAEVARLLQPVQTYYPYVTLPYLVPNLKGLQTAIELDVKEVAVFLAVSEAFSKANINQSVEESFVNIEPVIQKALSAGLKVRGYLSTIFGYDDMAFTPEIVAKRSMQLLDMGCYEVSLGDTTGIGKPETVEALIQAMTSQGVPLEKLAMHFHDTFGTAIANVAKAYELGIHTFDASTGGLGGCPYANSPKGNLAMEHLVHWCWKENVDCEVETVDLLEKAVMFMQEKLGKSSR